MLSSPDVAEPLLSESGYPKRQRRYSRDVYMSSLSIISVVASIAALLGFMSMRIVEPAAVAVVITFGSVGADTLSSGLHFVNPFASTTPFTLKTQVNLCQLKRRCRLCSRVLIH